MRSRFRQIAHVLLAPVGYLMFAGQSESTNANVNVGSANTWKNYDAMPLEKNGDWDKSGLSMSLCPMMVLKDRHPGHGVQYLHGHQGRGTYDAHRSAKTR